MRCLQTEFDIPKFIILTLVSALLAPAATNAAEEATPFPIAGVNPHQRPENAPVITDISRDDDWYKKALHGVEAPYPASLQFLEDQGNWHTPFTHRGMTGRYDIRKWYSE